MSEKSIGLNRKIVEAFGFLHSQFLLAAYRCAWFAWLWFYFVDILVLDFSKMDHYRNDPMESQIFEYFSFDQTFFLLLLNSTNEE